MITGFGSSSTSTSSITSSLSSRCFLKPLVIVSTTRDLRMALKISSSPSMATKWQLALRQAWTDAPSENQERCKQKIIIRNDKPMKERWTRNFLPVDALQSRTMLPTYVVDSMSNWRRIGSYSLLSLQGVLSLMSWVFFVTRLKRTSSMAMPVLIELSSAIGQMENVEESTLG